MMSSIPIYNRYARDHTDVTRFIINHMVSTESILIVEAIDTVYM